MIVRRIDDQYTAVHATAFSTQPTVIAPVIRIGIKILKNYSKLA
jgi:hypothetical protein